MSETETPTPRKEFDMAYREEQLDEDMCCVICGEHVLSDPHAPECPSHVFLLDDESEEGEQ